MMSPSVRVEIDLHRIRRNAEQIAARVGVEVWATIKADAYGLGAAKVAQTLRDVVAGFCVFAREEATSIDLWNLTRRPAMTMGPPADLNPAAWLAAHVRPAVSTVEQAARLIDARPILCVDTGMQRFACPQPNIADVLQAGRIDEAYTHATRLEHAERLVEWLAPHHPPGQRIKLHAAASSLLDEPAALLDAVRPGLALYRGAARITAPLVEATDSTGPVGYTAWPSETGRHGVILAGYSHGLRPGPCLVNGRRQRLPEVGMQTSYVTLSPGDRPGDVVTLLGDDLIEADVAFAWGTSPHQTLMQLAGAGVRHYVEG